MRQLKFRVWNERAKEMYTPDHIANDIDMGKYQVMQFTGLLDKNGVEIYEGDIVLFTLPGFGIEKTRVIEWSEKGYGTMLEQFHREVIGNIYENKSLLDNP